MANRFFENANKLREMGFRRHRFYDELAMRMCSDEEIEQSRKIWIEEAKEIVSSYGPEPMPIHGCSVGFKSTVLNVLRSKRDSAGYDYKWWLEKNGKEKWNYFLSPADQKINQLKYLDEKLWVEFENTRKKQFDEIILIELAQFSSHPLFQTSHLNLTVPTKESDYRNWTESTRQLSGFILRRELEGLGLMLDKKSSTASRFVFIRHLSKKFELRFIFEINFKTFSAHLVVCDRMLRKKTSYIQHPFQQFRIRLADTIIGGHSYDLFNSTNELVVSLMAQVELYRLERNYLDYFLGEIFDEVNGWLSWCKN